MSKKKILILSITDQDCDPRVIRQMDFLKEDYDIYCCGTNNKRLSPEKFFQLKRTDNSISQKITIGTLKLLKFYDHAEKFVLRQKYKIDERIKAHDFVLIIANDMDSVALAFNNLNGRNVLGDFHEFAEEEFEDKLYWKYIHKDFITYQSKKYLHSLSSATTVCQSIADKYKERFSKSTEVITNASKYYDLKPSPVGDKIRILHHGAAIRSRKIELMIETAKLLDKRYVFDLMLIPNDPAYYEKLKKISADQENINIIPPVKFEEIVSYGNSYDIGLFVLPPVNLNYKYALPNKFFEFIQSRLAVVTGPSPEMAKYIREFNLGFVSDTFENEEIAEKLNALSKEDIENFKKNSHIAAKELSAEKSKEKFLEIVKKILEK